jgi:hypothetical protein
MSLSKVAVLDIKNARSNQQTDNAALVYVSRCKGITYFSKNKIFLQKNILLIFNDLQ